MVVFATGFSTGRFVGRRVDAVGRRTGGDSKKGAAVGILVCEVLVTTGTRVGGIVVFANGL